MLTRPRRRAVPEPKIGAPWLDPKIRWFPILFFQFYLTLTIINFAFGPWPWPLENPLQTYGFLILVQLALFIGYAKGLQRPPVGYVGPVKTSSLIKVVVFVSILWIGPNFYINRHDVTSVQGMMEQVKIGISDPGQQYKTKIEIKGISATGPSVVMRLFAIVSPITSLVFPLGVIYWRRLNFQLKVGVLLALIGNLMSWVAVGTTKGVADFFLVLPWLVLIRNTDLLTRIRIGRLVSSLVMVVVALAIVLGFFTRVKVNDQFGIPKTMYDADIRISARRGGYLNLMPIEMRHGYSLLTSYLSQGYYALSLSMEEPFVWSYGFGHGLFSSELSRRFFGPEVVLSRTYPSRIQHRGWNLMSRWHSIYPWLASDLSFPGTVLIMGWIGYLFALMWLDCLRNENPFAPGIFSLFLILFYYIPANNQTFGFFRSATASWALLFAWWITRHMALKHEMRLRLPRRLVNF